MFHWIGTQLDSRCCRWYRWYLSEFLSTAEHSSPAHGHILHNFLIHTLSGMHRANAPRELNTQVITYNTSGLLCHWVQSPKCKRSTSEERSMPGLFSSRRTESKFRVRSMQSKPILTAVMTFATDTRRILQTVEQRGRETCASSATITWLQLKEYLRRQSHAGCMSTPISSS